MTYTINIATENKPGVLYRITGLLTKRKINIENLNAFETKKPGISQITITADIEPTAIDTLVKQMDKIVEIVNIKYHVAHR
ncbi:acetolactate synthase small subunit [Candidatus Roizmanbacteria bacterium CG_4_10_14_0_8_um_filter_39_9]|uniref:Acetolactate synthase small subunit n=1 Tax=Candidatus Roizmanbacteria bacterium CG_4_10_14_0_8_um_filter_39_9 TaxID=1974829 RepID=A0A2M7QCI2_9BACT|nr:MAG: acetolactate synthase small subunit [Candidatus Roizmanbacteria bacterium CG_4_10_14_0_8_um_filter_39_9]